ncbi:MAG: hypothetical protein HYV07_04895 [Deltaproteobacteria bacterium]|nr:hypothetical protein [Deltaproteobacteria bacterium]
MPRTIVIDSADGPIEHRIYIYSEDRNRKKKLKSKMIAFVDASCVQNASEEEDVELMVKGCSGNQSLLLDGVVKKLEKGGVQVTLGEPEDKYQPLVDEIESGIVKEWYKLVQARPRESAWTPQQRQTLKRAGNGQGAGPLAKLARDLGLSSTLYTFASFLRCNEGPKPTVHLRPENPLDWVFESQGTGPNGPLATVNQSTLYYYSQALLVGHAKRAVQVMPSFPATFLPDAALKHLIFARQDLQLSDKWERLVAVRARNFVVHERVRLGELTLRAFIQETPTLSLFARLARADLLELTIEFIEHFLSVRGVEVVVLGKAIQPLAYIELGDGQKLAGRCHHPWEPELSRTALSASVNAETSAAAVKELLRREEVALSATELKRLASAAA